MAVQSLVVVGGRRYRMVPDPDPNNPTAQSFLATLVGLLDPVDGLLRLRSIDYQMVKWGSIFLIGLSPSPSHVIMVWNLSPNSKWVAIACLAPIKSDKSLHEVEAPVLRVVLHEVEHVFEQHSFLVAQGLGRQHVVEVPVDHVVLLEVVVNKVLLRLDDLLVPAAGVLAVDVDVHLPHDALQQQIFKCLLVLQSQLVLGVVVDDLKEVLAREYLVVELLDK